MKSIIIIKSIVLLLFISCNKKEKDFPMNNTNGADIKRYKELALIKGDTSAYYQLSLDYMDSPYEGFLYPALIMANKYGYHLAYADVYHCLTSHDHEQGVSELKDLDERTRAMALEYLKEGAKREIKNAK